MTQIPVDEAEHDQQNHDYLHEARIGLLAHDQWRNRDGAGARAMACHWDAMVVTTWRTIRLVPGSADRCWQCCAMHEARQRQGRRW